MPQLPKEHRDGLIKQYEERLATAESAQDSVSLRGARGKNSVAAAEDVTSEHAMRMLKVRENRLLLDELRHGADTGVLESIGEGIAMLGALISSAGKKGMIPSGIGTRMLLELEKKDAKIQELRDEIAALRALKPQTPRAQTPPAGEALATPKAQPAPEREEAAAKPITQLPQGMPEPPTQVKDLMVGSIPNTYRVVTRIGGAYSQIAVAGKAFRASQEKSSEKFQTEADEIITATLSEAVKEAAKQAKPGFVMSQATLNTFDEVAAAIVDQKVPEIIKLRKQREGQIGEEYDMFLKWSSSFSGKDPKAKIAKSINDLYRTRIEDLKADIVPARSQYSKAVKAAERSCEHQVKESFVHMAHVFKDIWKEDSARQTPDTERVVLVFKYFESAIRAIVQDHPPLKGMLSLEYDALKKQVTEMMRSASPD